MEKQVDIAGSLFFSAPLYSRKKKISVESATRFLVTRPCGTGDFSTPTLARTKARSWKSYSAVLAQLWQIKILNAAFREELHTRFAVVAPKTGHPVYRYEPVPQGCLLFNRRVWAKIQIPQGHWRVNSSLRVSCVLVPPSCFFFLRAICERRMEVSANALFWRTSAGEGRKSKYRNY